MGAKMKSLSPSPAEIETSQEDPSPLELDPLDMAPLTPRVDVPHWFVIPVYDVSDELNDLPPVTRRVFPHAR